MPATARRRYVLRAASVVVTALVLVFVAGVLRRDGPAALEAWRAARVRWAWVGVATACGFIGPATSVVGWRRLLGDLGLPVRFGWVLRLFLLSNLGRYLPAGKAWQLGIVTVMSTERGLPAALVVGTSFLHALFGAVVGFILLSTLGGALFPGAGPLLALGVAGLAGLLALPTALRRFPSLRARLVKRISGIDTVDTATMWTVTWTAAVAWSAWGAALYALAQALLPTPVAPLGIYIAAWVGSIFAGLLAVFTPLGLGVREGAMQATLVTAGLEPSGALLLVIVVRVFATILELVPAAILLAAEQFAAREPSLRLAGPD
jgi:hypothetical protein